MSNISISRDGLPETVLPPENPEIVNLLDAALQLDDQNLRREKT